MVVADGGGEAGEKGVHIGGRREGSWGGEEAVGGKGKRVGGIRARGTGSLAVTRIGKNTSNMTLYRNFVSYGDDRGRGWRRGGKGERRTSSCCLQKKLYDTQHNPWDSRLAT